jgi:hypothetical protein
MSARDAAPSAASSPLPHRVGRPQAAAASERGAEPGPRPAPAAPIVTTHSDLATMLHDPSLPPSARPLARRRMAVLVGAGLLAGLLVAGALAGDRWLADRAEWQRAASAFIAPYQELFLASLPGAEAAEYVVFLGNDADPAAVERFFASQQRVQRLREPTLAGLLIVTLAGDHAEALELLRAQPFVRLAVRNQGVFFCH